MTMQGQRHTKKTKRRLSEAHRGRKRTEESKRRQSAEMKLTTGEKLTRDLEMLAALGQTKSWEYAEHMGISEQTAKNRLRRLFERGMADRHRKRGEVGWTYQAVKS
jgi:DNA-directed RNA polymerase specialized sigma24 family protein